MRAKKRIVIFSGAGISAESGIETFRKGDEALWANHSVDDVATLEGWAKDKEKVLNFYNERRRQLSTVEPNYAHKAIAELEKDYHVSVITQNIDDLHERAGSTTVHKLHGDLLKGIGENSGDVVNWPGDMKVGDVDEFGGQIRPHVVWFGEMPLDTVRAVKALERCDYLIIVGTSLQIGYTVQWLKYTAAMQPNTKIYYLDPKPELCLGMERVNYVVKKATEGIDDIINDINKENPKEENNVCI